MRHRFIDQVTNTGNGAARRIFWISCALAPVGGGGEAVVALEEPVEMAEDVEAQFGRDGGDFRAWLVQQADCLAQAQSVDEVGGCLAVVASEAFAEMARMTGAARVEAVRGPRE